MSAAPDLSWMDENPDFIPPDGAAVLNHAEAYIRRFCSFPDEHALVAVTLWAAHAHMVETFYTTPRLALLSPEAGSGKTRVLEVIDLLVPRPMFCLSASAAAIFRTLANDQVTLLFDEVDTVFAKRGKEDANEDLRALLNAGYKRGATIPRCVGPRHDVQSFAVFAATALASLGDLPDTVMSRSIIIRMRRRAPNERVEPFRLREQEASGHAIRGRLAEWAYQVGPAVGLAWPALPEGVADRPAEVWEPLIAVADAAGGGWPERARKACTALVRVAQDRRLTLGIRLLGDLRIIFGWADVLPTGVILDRLCDRTRQPDGESYLDPDAPWSELNGKGLNDRGLASMLRKYEIHPVKVKTQGKALQGYRREALHDAWQRYLPPIPQQAEPAEPSATMTGQVPEVPDNAGRGSRVQCRACKYFDGEDGASNCLKFDRPVDPEDFRDCPAFGLPIILS
jgi:hypothetical protein